MVINLKSGMLDDWYNWTTSEIMSICQFYIDIGWCKKYEDNLRQYEEFQQSVLRVNNNKEKVLSGIIDRSPGLLQYLMIHSVFDIDDYIHGDWLVKFMIEKLSPTDKDVADAHNINNVPEWVMKELSIFDPKPIGFEGLLDNTEIYFKMFGDWRKGESTDPITIVDKAWKGYGKKIPNEKLAEILSSYDNIRIN